MLMMRRHEKDFMLRRDAKYGDEMKKRASEFVAAVDNADIPEAAKTELKQKLADYQRDFLAWMETALTVARELKATSDSFSAVEPVIEAVSKAVDEYQGRSRTVEHSGARRIQWQMEIAILLIAATVMGAGLFIGRSVSKPLSAMTLAMIELAKGNFGIVLPGLGRPDEIGEIAQAVETFKINAEQKARDEAEAKIRQDQAAAKQRKADMIKLADDFEGAVGEIVETVSSASTELEASAGTLTSTAVRSQELATMVAAASEEASTNVQSVASATEELTSSVNEISRQVQELARMANEAVDQVHKTNDRVSELTKAAARIGDVVELINTIAGQTNLLASNATIEAARAGEAGRGFAVVASEVKALAEQTAKATGEIGQQISGIQSATRGFRQRHQGNRRHHRKAVRDFIDHRGRGGRAGRGDPGNLPQCAAGGAGHDAGELPHHRRPAGRRRDRIGVVAGSLGGAVAVRRKQPPQARSRQVPELGARRLRAPVAHR